MRFMTRLLLAGVVTIGVGAIAAPTEAAAQCTVKCGCISGGCGCQGKGGNGSSCSASGNGCFVSECEALVSLDRTIFAPDGSIVTRRVNTSSASVDGASALRAEGDEPQEPWVSWETLPSGIAVAKNCAGLVVQRYVQTVRALALRDDTRVLATQD